MTYEEMKSYIAGVNSYGICLGLERIRELLKRLSNPEKNLKVIHVAGTNGKGSFSTFISQILIESGYKVGRYLSPTLYDYREKVQINHQWIKEDEVAEIMTELCEVCHDMEEDGFEHPTLFEIETAMAFMYFKAQECDFVVLEVGMGGREDSTNVIEHPVLSVITSISLDHTHVLGKTLEAITMQKSGIIKKACPVLVYDQDEKILDIIKREAVLKHATMTVTDWNSLQIKGTGLTGQCFNYKNHSNYQIVMAGLYQTYNAAAAIDAAHILSQLGVNISEDAIYEGLVEAQWPGRFEVLAVNPYVIVDGAHNEGGAKALEESIETYFKGKKLIGLMGVFADKDYKKILQIIGPHLKMLYTHKPKSSRGLDSDKLKNDALEICNHAFPVVDAVTVTQAVDMAIDEASADDVIISFGSLSTIAQLDEHIRKGEIDG